MPLFESQDKRNDRIVQTLQVGTMNRLLNTTADEGVQMHVSAWLLGGSLAAKSAVRLPSVLKPASVLKEAWGKGDSTRALLMFELFTPAMMWRWLRRVEDEQENPESADLRFPTPDEQKWASFLAELFSQAYDAVSPQRTQSAFQQFIELGRPYNRNQDAVAVGKETPMGETAALYLYSLAVLRRDMRLFADVIVILESEEPGDNDHRQLLDRCAAEGIKYPDLMPLHLVMTLAAEEMYKYAQDIASG